MMFPNEKYQLYFPDAVLPAERPEAMRSCCLRIGSYIVIKQVLNEYGLPEMLFKRLGVNSGLFFDLAAFSIIDQDNAGQYYQGHTFCHPLFSSQMHIYSDSTVRSRSEVDRPRTDGQFTDDWNARQDKEPAGIHFRHDSTNKNCQAGDIDLR